MCGLYKKEGERKNTLILYAFNILTFMNDSMPVNMYTLYLTILYYSSIKVSILIMIHVLEYSSMHNTLFAMHSFCSSTIYAALIINNLMEVEQKQRWRGW